MAKGALAEEFAADYAEAFAEYYRPDDANYERVRLVGGTENVVGERPDATEDLHDLHLVIHHTPSADLDMQAVGAVQQDRFSFTILEDDLVLGDTIRSLATGQVFRVTRYVQQGIDANEVAWDGTATARDTKPGPEAP